ncbi:MAG: TonB family protein [Hyphomicrobium sp.]|nr:TonB family protein [Hyphomicrobium sp.]
MFWVERSPGAITPPTEAASVELLQSEVLEAVTAQSVEAAASPASVQSVLGDTVEQAAASAPATEQLKPVDPTEQVDATDVAAVETEQPTPKGLDSLEGALETEEQAGTEKAASDAPPNKAKELREPSRRERPVKTAKLHDPSEPRKTESRSKQKGGAASRATQGSAASAGRVSASRGSAINYAAIVRARVASRKPPAGGQRGTVVVSFGVSKSGGLAYASIARSSGNPGLDGRVLSAVRGAGPFPPPPPGAGLRFAIPFYFR